jgi:predicted MFS family arabinose efflux permease
MPASSATVAGLLAHQGGWDEILLVLAPIAVISVLILLARRRIGAPPGRDRP